MVIKGGIDMSEMIKFWFSNLYKSELENVNGTISNMELWVKGSNDDEETKMFEENIEQLQEYKGELMALINELGV